MSEQPRDLSSWLPTLLGPVDLRANGSPWPSRRLIWDFVGGITVEDVPNDADPLLSYTRLTFSGEGGSGPAVPSGVNGNVVGLNGSGGLSNLGVFPTVIAGDNVTIDVLPNRVYRVHAAASGTSGPAVPGGNVNDVVGLAGDGTLKNLGQGAIVPEGNADDLVGLVGDGTMKSMGPSAEVPAGLVNDVVGLAGDGTLKNLGPMVGGGSGSGWTAITPSQTTDAETKSALLIPTASLADGIYDLRVQLRAISYNGSDGGAALIYDVQRTFLVIGGTVVVNGLFTTLRAASLPTPSAIDGAIVSIDSISTDIRVRVTGAAAWILNWSGEYMIGIGLALGSGASAPTFNPATLALSLWEKDYAGDPWASTASAGTSAGKTLTAGAPPPSGANFGTHPSADFNGVGHFLILGGALKLNALLSRTAYFVQVIIEADSAAAAAAQPYNDVCLLGENGGNFYLTFASHAGVPGVRAGHYDDATFKVTATSVPCSLGVKHCVQMWFDGTTISVRVDGGAPQTVAAGQLTAAYNAIVPSVGKNLAQAVFFDGRIADIKTAITALTAPQRDALYQNARAEYGLP